MNMQMDPSDSPVHSEDIIAGLRRLGVHSGDTLLVHSSLSSFGHVDGGADTVIDSLLAAVGTQGNIIMPTLSFKSMDESNPYFSVMDTSSDTGKITEVFRKRPEARRSRHPLSSAAVIGKNADEFTSGKQHTPCGEDSPYQYLYRIGGSVVFLGAGFQSNTLFHVAEELVAPSYMCYKKLENVLIRNAFDELENDTFYRYDCYQSGIIRKLERLENVYRERGLLRETTVGACRITLISAKDDIDATCDILEHSVDFLLS